MSTAISEKFDTDEIVNVLEDEGGFGSFEEFADFVASRGDKGVEQRLQEIDDVDAIVASVIADKLDDDEIEAAATAGDEDDTGDAPTAEQTAVEVVDVLRESEPRITKVIVDPERYDDAMFDLQSDGLPGTITLDDWKDGPEVRVFVWDPGTQSGDESEIVVSDDVDEITESIVEFLDDAWIDPSAPPQVQQVADLIEAREEFPDDYVDLSGAGIRDGADLHFDASGNTARVTVTEGTIEAEGLSYPDDPFIEVLDPASAAAEVAKWENGIRSVTCDENGCDNVVNIEAERVDDGPHNCNVHAGEDDADDAGDDTDSIDVLSEYDGVSGGTLDTLHDAHVDSVSELAEIAAEGPLDEYNGIGPKTEWYLYRAINGETGEYPDQSRWEELHAEYGDDSDDNLQKTVFGELTKLAADVSLAEGGGGDEFSLEIEGETVRFSEDGDTISVEFDDGDDTASVEHDRAEQVVGEIRRRLDFDEFPFADEAPDFPPETWDVLELIRDRLDVGVEIADRDTEARRVAIDVDTEGSILDGPVQISVIANDDAEIRGMVEGESVSEFSGDASYVGLRILGELQSRGFSVLPDYTAETADRIQSSDLEVESRRTDVNSVHFQIEDVDATVSVYKDGVLLGEDPPTTEVSRAEDPKDAVRDLRDEIESDETDGGEDEQSDDVGRYPDDDVDTLTEYGLDDRYVQLFHFGQRDTVGDVLEFFEENGRDGFDDVPGIGDKGVDQLVDVLEAWCDASGLDFDDYRNTEDLPDLSELPDPTDLDVGDDPVFMSGEYLREVRKSRTDWTMSELAERVGISDSFVGELERCSTLASLEVYDEWLDALPLDDAEREDLLDAVEREKAIRRAVGGHDVVQLSDVDRRIVRRVQQLDEADKREILDAIEQRVR